MRSPLRSLARRLSRGVVLERRLPPEFSSLRLYVTPDSALRFWRRRLGAEEQGLLRWAQEHVRPGSVVWDVGANVGVFAFAAAARAGARGRVLAVEADPFLAGLLRRTASRSPPGVAPVSVLEAAACDRQGAVAFHVAANGRASSHLAGAGQSTAGGAREVRQVAGVTLDSLRRDHGAPALVKIDVEGAEDAVLRGARELLSVERPVLLCEVSDATRGNVSRQLRDLGYRLYDAEAPPSERGALQEAPWNTLALPQEIG